MPKKELIKFIGFVSLEFAAYLVCQAYRVYQESPWEIEKERRAKLIPKLVECLPENFASGISDCLSGSPDGQIGEDLHFWQNKPSVEDIFWFVLKDRGTFNQVKKDLAKRGAAGQTKSIFHEVSEIYLMRLFIQNPDLLESMLDYKEDPKQKSSRINHGVSCSAQKQQGQSAVVSTTGFFPHSEGDVKRDVTAAGHDSSSPGKAPPPKMQKI